MIIQNPSGLSVEFLENGNIKTINAGKIRVSLKASSSFTRSGANIWLRKKGRHPEFIPLLGPESHSVFAVKDNVFFVRGSYKSIEYTLTLHLDATAPRWYWDIELLNNTGEPIEADLVYVQDLGLKQSHDGLVNEYYVAQYIERTILQDERCGPVVCCRQNMKENGGHPWMMISCTPGAVAGSTDGMQFYGKSFRQSAIPEGLTHEKLTGEYAGESPVVALQSRPRTLQPGKVESISFSGVYMHDHPGAISSQDLSLIGDHRKLSVPSPEEWDFPVRNSFNTCDFLAVEDLTEEERIQFFGNEWRHPEYHQGTLLSFFCHDHDHVVLHAKELLTDRPHGHIMQARAGFEADESIVSTTSYAFGVFNSHLSQGNTNFNVLLSVCTSAFNENPACGQRIFVESGRKRFLLGIPSAFEMGLNHCRWIYKNGDAVYQVRTWTSKSSARVFLDFKVLKGEAVKLLITHDFDTLNGWRAEQGLHSQEYFFKPLKGSMIDERFPDARFRMMINTEHVSETGDDSFLFDDNTAHAHSLFVVVSGKTREYAMSFTCEVSGTEKNCETRVAGNQFSDDCREATSVWKDLSLQLSVRGNHPDIQAINEILPWYGMNALTHFLTPYGLEQFGGAAWGTRDVAQGPFDLLMTSGKYPEARKMLELIFSNQNPEGGWPQWWMFDSYHTIRADSAHGDIFYWCLIALSQYVTISGDSDFLDKVLPYYHPQRSRYAEQSALSEHVGRLVNMITGSFIPGTALVPFGGGDWNDSLQPVSKDLAQRMISGWTVEMNYQAFLQLASMYESIGLKTRADALSRICDSIRSDFNRYLVKSGTVAGYGLVEGQGDISVLLHPDDQQTKIHYSLLPMNRGIISGIFTPEQAVHHQELTEKYLKGPDGARLMDRPLQYKGGIQHLFQRAESSTFFGREIGLMYFHEHIRYAEALAITGKAEAFVQALRQAIPVAYKEVVHCGDLRQANCYYSSSDVTFKSRYEADERYEEVIQGKFPLKGGWRIYSSGPGIYIGMIIRRLLGIRPEKNHWVLDPVLPFSMDGITASLKLLDQNITFIYRVKEGEYSPKMLTINGMDVKFQTEGNRYRKGGALIPWTELKSLLNREENIIEILL